MTSFEFDIPDNELDRLEELSKLLGRGGYGVVYGYPKDSIRVAVKRIPISYNTEAPDRAAVDTVMKEVKIHRGLRHPNLVRYGGSRVYKNDMFIYMEYVEGGSLKEYLINTQLPNTTGRSNLDCIEILGYISQILSGLSYLHQQGIIHRDLRCVNILRSKSGNLKITDFGISKKLEGFDKSAFSSVVGNPYWQSPEMINKEVEVTGRKCDIWSLGIVILELSCVTPSFMKRGYQYLYTIQIYKKQLPAIPEFLYPELERLLSFCLVFDPEERPSAKELLNRVREMQRIRQEEENPEKQKRESSRNQHIALYTGFNPLQSSSSLVSLTIESDFEFIEHDMCEYQSYVKDTKVKKARKRLKTTVDSTNLSGKPLFDECSYEYNKLETFLDWIKKENPASMHVVSQYERIRQDRLSYEYLRDARRYLVRCLGYEAQTMNIAKIYRYKYDWTWWEMNREQIIQLIDGQVVRLSSQCHIKSCPHYWSAIHNVTCISLTANGFVNIFPRLQNDNLNDTEHAHSIDSYRHLYLSGLGRDNTLCSLITSSYNEVIMFLSERQFVRVCALVAKPITEKSAKCNIL